jgi:peptide/nickel transport system substrate-binding protein
MKFLRAFLAATALLATAACAAPKDSVTIGIALEPPGLDPTTGAAASIGDIVHYNVFEGLTKIGDDFSVTPLLAESWTVSPDAKTLTFKLRKGVHFQNGEPLTSQDVKFSFERAAAADSTNKEKAFFQSIAATDATDPDVVIPTFKAPSFDALFHLGLNTAVIVEPKSAATNGANPVGAGPYKLAEWSRGSAVTLKKWDGYRDAGKVAIATATFRFINDSSAQVAGLLAGDIDAIPRFDGLASLDQFKSDERFQVIVGGTEGKTILAINNKRKPFDDLRVRQALAFAVDRKALIEGAVNGLGAPIGSHLVPSDPGYVDLTGEYAHDPEKAKALLKAAGVTTPLNVGLILPPPSYARRGGEIVAAELAEVGIQAKIENVEWAQWLSGVYKDKNYDLTIISHVEPLDIGIYANPDYYFQYDSQKFRDIYAKLTAAPDLAAFKAAIGDAQRQLADDSVNVFLFQLQQASLADARLTDLWRNAPIFATDLAALSWR